MMPDQRLVGLSLPLGPEMMARLDRFVSMLVKWNGAINLVSKSSLDDVWRRHISDSLQIFDFRGRRGAQWCDFGSGSGLPGMVVAIAAAEHDPDLRVSLVESDRRKAEFLRHVSRETGVAVEVLPRRIEELTPRHADVVSARALAPLDDLCANAHHHLNPGGRGIFLKGAKAEAEIATARRRWSFDLQQVPSITEHGSSILILTNLRHV